MITRNALLLFSPNRLNTTQKPVTGISQYDLIDDDGQFFHRRFQRHIPTPYERGTLIIQLSARHFSQMKRLSDEQISATAGSAGYHMITGRRRCGRVRRYRRVPIAIRRYLQGAIIERWRRWMLTLPMPSQIDLPLKRLVAETALKWLVARVLAHMSDQVAALRERLAANDALVGFLTCNKSNSGVTFKRSFFLHRSRSL